MILTTPPVIFNGDVYPARLAIAPTSDDRVQSWLSDGNGDNIVTRAGSIRYQEFYRSKSKPLIDDVDRVLGKHYSFPLAELDFTINFDIKYRMGREADGEDEG